MQRIFTVEISDATTTNNSPGITLLKNFPIHFSVGFFGSQVLLAFQSSRSSQGDALKAS